MPNYFDLLERSRTLFPTASTEFRERWAKCSLWLYKQGKHVLTGASVGWGNKFSQQL